MESFFLASTFKGYPRFLLFDRVNNSETERVIQNDYPYQESTIFKNPAINNYIRDSFNKCNYMPANEKQSCAASN